MSSAARKKILDITDKEYRGGNSYTSPVFIFLKKPVTPIKKSS
jgi:hypothetical protein